MHAKGQESSAHLACSANDHVLGGSEQHHLPSSGDVSLGHRQRM